MLPDTGFEFTCGGIVCFDFKEHIEMGDLAQASFSPMTRSRNVSNIQMPRASDCPPVEGFSWRLGVCTWSGTARRTRSGR